MDPGVIYEDYTYTEHTEV